VLSGGEEFDSTLIVWTAGNTSNPGVHNHTALPVDDRGLLVVRADLRVGTDGEPVPDVRAAGDDAAVPDLASPVPEARMVPNAQHAVRQVRLLARNLAASLRGGGIRLYQHSVLGVAVALTLGRGVFQYKSLVIKGLPAWLMHPGYHELAVPSWERTIRVLTVWPTAAVFGRDCGLVTARVSAHDRRSVGGACHRRASRPVQGSEGRGLRLPTLSGGRPWTRARRPHAA
jgi:NADH dehydrogenase